MGEERDRMPKRVYTVGDTIRLRVTFDTEANVEEVKVVYQRDTPRSVTDPPGGRVTFEGTVEETEVIEDRPYHLPIKRSSAQLISYVDVDHLPGSYVLERVILRTVGGIGYYLFPEEGDDVSSDTFRIADEGPLVRSVKVLMEEDPSE